MQETQVQSLGPEDPLEKNMATHSTVLPRKLHEMRSHIPWNEGTQRDRYNWTHTGMHIVTIINK